MVIALTVKDMRAHGTLLFLRILPATLVIASLFIFRYYGWHVFMVYGYMAMSTALIQLGLQEINPSHRILTTSLPVTRLQVVLSRYLSGLLIAGIYTIFWYLTGIASSALFPNAMTDFSNALHLKSLVITYTFTVLFVSFYIPATFIFGQLGTILTTISALVIAISSVSVLFYPHVLSYVPVLLPSDRWFVFGLFPASALLLSISIILSVRCFTRKDI